MKTKMKKATALAILLGTLTQTSGCFLLAAGGIVALGNSAHDRRDFGTQVNDSTIEFRLADKLRKNPLTSTSHIRVVSNNYHVLVAGEAANQTAIDTAQQLAEVEPGVKKVWNQIRLMPNSGPLQRSNDALTTARIKAGMLQINNIPGFDPTRVNITTINSIAYLMGTVTPQEAEAAKNFTRTVAGVQGVVALFEINPMANQLRQVPFNGGNRNP